MHPVTDVAPAPQTPLDYALAYAALGYAVIPLHSVDAAGACSCGRPHDGAPLSANSRGKHPHTLHAPRGVHSASKDPAVIRRWFEVAPHLNIGLACGEPSGFIAVDIDPRDGGDATWEDFLSRNGAVEPATLIAQTGGAGRHVLFAYDPAVRVRSPGKGVQIKADGGYIVAEPSTHVSGRRYAWSADGDPMNGGVLARLPPWLIAPRQAEVHTIGGKRLTGYLDPQRIADLRAALTALDHDDYTAWISVGMALHSTDAAEAFEIWDEWSRNSPKYDEAAQRAKWMTFGGRHGLHVESIFTWAMDQGWSGQTTRVAVPVETVSILAPRAAATASAALGLLELPGHLQGVVDFANRTAPKPQPAFAVGAALALGSVCCGRRFRALPRYNWPSLYFVHVGKSSSGKEHARTVINTVLTAAEWPELMGRSGYTSDTAVFSALWHQPAHLAMIDEMGALLLNNQDEGNFQSRSGIVALTEAWGTLHGIFRPKSFSTHTLPADQAAAMMKRQVINPALSLLGLTTPENFYRGLGEDAIHNGLLGRLIVIDTEIGRQMTADTEPLDVPQAVVDWVQGCRGAGAGRGNLSGMPVGPDVRPTPVDVPTDPAATAAFKAYERDVLKHMDALDEEGLAELEGRSVEKAMRLALILAVSSRVDAPRISPEHADWAVAFVRHWTARTLASVREHMHGSKFAQWQAAVLETIAHAGGRGRTPRELAQFSRVFNGLEIRQRGMVLEALAAKGAATLVKIPSPSGRPTQRTAWVAVAPDPNTDD